MTILVTGALGNVGQHVVEHLLALNLPTRAAVRRVDDVPDRWGEQVDALPMDFYDPQTWAPALQGCSGVFLMRPPAITDIDETLGPFIEQAYAQGVEHVVFLSVLGAEHNALVPHHKVERCLIAQGQHHTILRPGFFAQNIDSAYGQDIRQDDRIYVPAGRTPVRWIDARDIGEVAARVLSSPEAHKGRGYTLEGSELVSWERVVEVLSEVTGRRIQYVPASIPGYAWRLHKQGLKAELIAVQTILHALLRRKPSQEASGALEELLGRPARTVEAYIRDHAEVWRVDA